MLSPKPPLAGQHPDIRIDAASGKQFERKCKKAGTTVSAGVRQLVAAYLNRPFKFHPAEKGETCDAKLTGVRDTAANVRALKAKAKAAGITHSEAIRQIVHHYIDKGDSK